MLFQHPALALRKLLSALAVLTLTATSVSAQTLAEEDIYYSDSSDELFITQMGRVVTGEYASELGLPITFELTRGIERDELHRQHDPEAPPYEIDCRFLDSEGRTFILGFGGHGAMNPEWLLSAHGDAPAFPRARYWDFVHAAEGIELATELGQGRMAAPELQLLQNLAVTIRSDIEEFDPATLPDDPPLLLGTLYRHKTHIYKKNAGSYGHEWPITDHSAVKVNVYCQDPYYLSLITYTSNHGKAATHPDMHFKCYTNFRNRSNRVPPLGGCASVYGFAPVNEHVCNDDTRLQYNDVHNNTYNPFWDHCWEWGVPPFAPDCRYDP